MPISTCMYLAVAADAYLYMFYVPCSGYRCLSLHVICTLQWLQMPISTCIHLAVAADAHLYMFYVPCSGYRCPSLPVCTLQWLQMPISTCYIINVPCSGNKICNNSEYSYSSFSNYQVEQE